MPEHDSLMTRTRRYLRSRGVPLAPDRRPPMPSLDRTVVGVGPHGCFEGLDAEVRALLPESGPYRPNLLSKLYERDTRFHVSRCGDWDIAFYAPEGTGFAEHCDVHGHLDRCFDAVAARSIFAVAAEWGTHPSLAAPVGLLRSEGEPDPDMPSLALTCAQWSRYVHAPAPVERSGNEGPLSAAYGGAVDLFAVRGGPAEAVDVLRAETARFSRERIPLRPLDTAPREMLVAVMSEGLVSNLSGDMAAAEPAPRARYA